MRLAWILRQQRVGLGMGQEEVAKKLGMTQSQYSRIETGKANVFVHQLISICEMYDLNPASVMRAVMQ